MSIEQNINNKLSSLIRDELNIVARKLKIKRYRILTIDDLKEKILSLDQAKVKKALDLSWWDIHRVLFEKTLAVVSVLGFGLAIYQAVCPGPTKKEFVEGIDPISHDVKQIQSTLSGNPEFAAKAIISFIQQNADAEIAKHPVDWMQNEEIGRECERQVSKVKDLMEMVQKGLTDKSTPIYVQAVAILSSSDPVGGGPVNALAYLKASKMRILDEMNVYAADEETAQNKKKESLRPLLLAADLYEASLEWDLALECRRIVVKNAPMWWNAQTGLGLFLAHRALWAEADIHLRCAVDLATDEAIKAESLNNLSYLRVEQGLYSQAEILMSESLQIRERVLGKEHPKTIELIMGLAVIYGHQGKYEQSQKLLEHAIKVNEQVLGKEHPDTVNVANNLAALLINKGDHVRGCQMLMNSRNRDLKSGVYSPTSLNMALNVAGMYYLEGDLANAQQLNEGLLKVCERQLGYDHPETLRIVHNLALTFSAKSDEVDALKLITRAIKGRERVLGKEHPDTLASLREMVKMLVRKGDYSELPPLYERLLSASEQTLGLEHPDTLEIRKSLAVVLGNSKEYARSQRLLTQVLEARERVLGKDHPDTLASVHDLAHLLLMKGDYATALTLYERAVEVRERVLGKEHVDTLLSIGELAIVLCYRREYIKAKPLYERVFESSERSKGRDHPETLDIVNSLAKVHYQQGDYKVAQSYYERLLRFYLITSKKMQQPHAKLMESSGGFVQCMINQGRSEPDSLKVLADISKPYGMDVILTGGNVAR